MLEQVETMFDNMEDMIKRMKKKFYPERMDAFREKNGHYFEEMVAFAEASEDKEAAAQTIANTFTDAVFQAFQVKGKVNAGKQIDLNLFMIYFVFPALLMTEHEEAKGIADALCNSWNGKFENTKIGYSTYDAIYSSFREKIFGIF